MAEERPTLVWFRRDLRLDDHPALAAAVQAGAPVIPVFLLDPVMEAMGAAPKWRTGLALEALAAELARRGSRLVLRRGVADIELPRLARETDARALHLIRAHDPDGRRRDRDACEALQASGVTVERHDGAVLFEPDRVATKQGGYYKVFTPFWRAVRVRDVAPPLPAPETLPAPARWPESDRLEAWNLGAAMNRGAAVVRPWARPGEAAAADRLAAFLHDRVDAYPEARDRPAVAGTSDLSEHLATGEISPGRCWHAALRAREEGRQGVETFLKELAWRDFAYHLMWHTPRLVASNWRPEWDRFPWNEDAALPRVRAWRQGRTGMPFVDAGLREMQVTGRMHNRARMIVASYLTKHLMTHWRIGADWFAEHLIDWDPANNALGWQWAAGSGPDASPFFRVFNPAGQLDRFDPDRAYVRRWIAEGQSEPPAEALAYFDAVPRSWRRAPGDRYPDPVVDAATGRALALAAYQDHKP
ncbi:cryptochrome/photolyase family protein [Roseivivax sp. CAU 1761]